jgi:hypothetical protein
MIRSESGVAAIEMALLMPILLLLFFGMIDATAALSDKRKLTQAAYIAADLTTRMNTPTNSATIGDIFNGVKMVLSNTRAPTPNIDIYVYAAIVNTTGDITGANVRWRRSSGTLGDRCEAPANNAALWGLMQDGSLGVDGKPVTNDIIVAVACAKHRPILADVIGVSRLGRLNFTLREQFAMRPRPSSTLVCPDCT